MEVTFHHLCHIILIRNKSDVALTLKRRELHKGMNTRRWGSLRVILGFACHSQLMAILVIPF